MKKSIGLLVIISMFVLSGCGKGESRKIVTNLNVETRENEQYEKFAHIDFELDLGSAELPLVSYDLPKNLGSLSLSLVDGKNFAAIDINLTEALKIPAGQATLPNGSTIPVYSSNGVIQIDIDAINGSIYLAKSGDVTMIGFALAITQLDGIGKEIGNVGLFPQFRIGKVKMVAGVFSDDEEKGTGVAAFANLNGLFEDEQLELDTTEKLYFKRYRYSRKLLMKAKRLLNEFETKKQVLTPVLR